MTDDRPPEPVRTGPLSWTSVYLGLQVYGPASPTALAERIGVPRQTVNQALSELQDAGVVSKNNQPEDARFRVYQVSDSVKPVT